MLTKTKIALAALLMLGTASAALASNENDGGNNTGGYVLPGNTVGVNPVYHRSMRDNAGHAYAYVPHYIAHKNTTRK
jgi:hypothetical protein